MSRAASSMVVLALLAATPVFPAEGGPPAGPPPLLGPATGPAVPHPAAPAAPGRPTAEVARPPARERLRDSYAVLKLGRFSPRGPDFEPQDDGFAGEIAFGRSFLGGLAAEFGIGFARSAGGPPAAPFRELEIVPVTLSLKGTVPVRIIDLHALAGVGGYYVDAEPIAAPSDSSWAFGYQAGAGGTINLGRLFVGLEARYLWAEADFHFARNVAIDGAQGAALIGLRY